MSQKKKDFNKIATHPLQSWEWGEFRKETGNEVVKTDFGQIMLHKIPFTSYKIATFIKGSMPTAAMIKELKKLANEENLIFIKLEPNYPIRKYDKSGMHVHGNLVKQVELKKAKRILKDSGCVKGKTLFTPTTFWIDLTKSEEELMKGFSSKTRYNIRLAQRKGVKVVEDNSKNSFEKYIELTRETVEKQGFYAHTEKYHRLMWKHLNSKLIANNEKPIARLLVAKYKGEIITTWIVFVWHDFLYYPYGASSGKYKNVMASNLMMWEAIRYGKKLGLKTFDLWGREPGKGFTRFKEGYNPQVVEFLGTWDLITSPLYYPYRASEFLRWQTLRAKSRFVKPTF